VQRQPKAIYGSVVSSPERAKEHPRPPRVSKFCNSRLSWKKTGAKTREAVEGSCQVEGFKGFFQKGLYIRVVK